MRISYKAIKKPWRKTKLGLILIELTQVEVNLENTV